MGRRRQLPLPMKRNKRQIERGRSKKPRSEQRSTTTQSEESCRRSNRRRKPPNYYDPQVGTEEKQEEKFTQETEAAKTLLDLKRKSPPRKSLSSRTHKKTKISHTKGTDSADAKDNTDSADDDSVEDVTPRRVQTPMPKPKINHPTGDSDDSDDDSISDSSLENLMLDTRDSGDKADMDALVKAVTKDNCNYRMTHEGYTPLLILCFLDWDDLDDCINDDHDPIYSRPKKGKGNVAKAHIIDDDWVYEQQTITPPTKLIKKYPNVSPAKVFSMGRDTQEAGMTQEVVDFLFNRWQTYLEKEKGKGNKWEKCAINLSECYHEMSKQLEVDKRKVPVDHSKDRRRIDTRMETNKQVKDRAVRNQFGPGINHIRRVQSLTTYHRLEDHDKNPKSQHIMLALDEFIPQPQHPNSQDNSGIEVKPDDKHIRKEPLSVFFLPPHVNTKKLGDKLMDIGKEMFRGTNNGIRFARTAQSYYHLLFGKTSKRFETECVVESAEVDKDNED